MNTLALHPILFFFFSFSLFHSSHFLSFLSSGFSSAHHFSATPLFFVSLTLPFLSFSYSTLLHLYAHENEQQRMVKNNAQRSAEIILFDDASRREHKKRDPLDLRERLAEEQLWAREEKKMLHSQEKRAEHSRGVGRGGKRRREQERIRGEDKRREEKRREDKVKKREREEREERNLILQ